jgi:hypothetical protein
MKMAFNFTDFQPFSQNLGQSFGQVFSQGFGKEQLEAATTAAGQLAKDLQAIAVETTDYSKKSLETGSAYVEKLLGVKSFDSAIQIQSEFAKTSYASFIAEATKLSELYANLARDAFKPVETAIAKIQPNKG